MRSKDQSKGSTLTSIFILLLLVVVFSFGVFLGSAFSENSPNDTHNLSAGLPGTRNILTKWSNAVSKENFLSVGRSLHLRSGVLSHTSPPYPDIHPDSSELPINGLHLQTLNSQQFLRPAQTSHFPQTISSQQEPSKHISIDQLLKPSLHVTPNTYMTVKGSHFDSENVLYSVWFRLDEAGSRDSTMRTIFTNKQGGCEVASPQRGVSLYVNGWETSDHFLYVEYGDENSGCNKLSSSSSSSVPLQAGQWYHALIAFTGAGIGEENPSVRLFLNGNMVAKREANRGDPSPSHSVSESQLYLGRYPDGQFPLLGNVSSFLVIQNPPSEESGLLALASRESGLGSTAFYIPDGASTPSTPSYSKIRSIPGVRAFFPLTDASEEIPDSQAKEEIRGEENGQYTFPSLPQDARSVPGVPIPLIDGLPKGRVVTEEMKAASDREAYQRREEIKGAMARVWSAYKDCAWGADEVKPQSCQPNDNWGGMAVTLVDSLDTLWLMGLRNEFDEAVQFIRNRLTFSRANSVSVFETTIRELGGLLAAFDLSGEKILLDKARELGDLLMPAFSTQSGIPSSHVNLQSHSQDRGWAGSSAILSELGTLQVEFRYLAEKTGRKDFEAVAMKPLQVMRRRRPQNGLYPIKVSIGSGDFADSQITFGALGDSFYEYLLKVWLQGGKKEAWLREMYDQAMDGAINVLLQAAEPSGMAFLADYNGRFIHRKMDHLVCFMPGLLALGAFHDPLGRDSDRARRDLSVAKALMFTCYQMYHQTASGISPEFVEFPPGRDMVTSTSAPFYILRPETAESLFILHQLTGDPIYRTWGWEIWTSIDRSCRARHGYGALSNVNQPPGQSSVDDRMESFFLAETLKYLYLLQDPDRPVDLSVQVFNTEAHPTRMFGEDSPHQPFPEH